MAGAAAAVPRRSRKRPRRCNAAASLPLDLLLEIAARSDPATLVRCAATSKDLRRRIADPVFRRQLRLRHADRFVPSLLRGFLKQLWYLNHLHLVDSATADATRIKFTAAAAFSSPAGGGRDGGDEAVRSWHPVAARDGLILVCGRVDWGPDHKLCVYCPATDRSRALPPGPCLHGEYILLVGDGDGDGGAAIGRPFQVLKACFVKPEGGSLPSLHIHTFSSEQGTWCSRISSNHLVMHGTQCPENPVVVGDTVQWLYNLNWTYYVLKVHVRAEKVTFRALPRSFQRAASRLLHVRPRTVRMQILMARSSSGRSPVVLVANNNGVVYAWEQSESAGKWSKRPQLIKDFGEMMTKMKAGSGSVRLEWFAERSGLVLVTVTAPDESSSFLLDLQSKEITECSSSYSTIPYEMDVSSWVPTFTRIF